MWCCSLGVSCGTLKSFLPYGIMFCLIKASGVDRDIFSSYKFLKNYLCVACILFYACWILFDYIYWQSYYPVESTMVFYLLLLVLGNSWTNIVRSSGLGMCSVLWFFCNRDSDKMIFLRLQKEFEAARAAQTEGSIFTFLFHWPVYWTCLVVW